MSFESSQFRLAPSGPVGLPRCAPGMRIGLYGGSFNPAHAGHRHVSLLVLKRLRLDRIWWIVTPGNPLKDRGELAPTPERVAGAKRLAAHPRIDVTSFEAAIGARYTIDTLSFLVRRCPGVDFVWIMGADNLASFHRWRGWQTIASLMPMVVVDRPGFTLKATRSRAAVRLAPYRIDEDAASALPGMPAPAWLFLHGPRSALSSSALRRGCRTSPLNGR